MTKKELHEIYDDMIENYYTLFSPDGNFEPFDYLDNSDDIEDFWIYIADKNNKKLDNKQKM